MAGRSGDGSPPLRVVFVGNAAWSVPSLEALAASGHEVARVLTPAPRPAGRGREPAATPVADGGARASASRCSRPRPSAPARASRPSPTRVRTCSWSSRTARSCPRRCCPIPRSDAGERPLLAAAGAPRRGAGAARHPRRASRHGRHDDAHGCRNGHGADPAAAIRPDRATRRTPGALGDRLAAIGGELLVETLDALAAGTLEERPQDEGGRLGRAQAHPGGRAARLAPAGGSRSPAGSARWRLRPGPPPVPPAPGSRSTASRRPAIRGRVPSRAGCACSRATPIVATGRGVLRLDEVQAEGRRRMAGGDWARGARLPEDAVLGE